MRACDVLRTGVGIWAVGYALIASAEPLPRMVIGRDDIEVTQSMRIEAAPGLNIEDRNGNGVIHVRASDITIELGDVPLSGALMGAAADGFTGVAIRIDGQKNVTIRGGNIRGYKAAVWASNADGLTIERLSVTDMWRQHLRSSVEFEDPRDWLRPHENDQREWFNKYGAAILIENSSGVTIRECRGYFGQNGLILSRVENARVYDNDFSFNSGWGIALWRSSGNTIAHNATDFCIRGYSHGVYNRGQDSAGILLFEQCSRNIIANNSATHCGDGLFAFAGREALGEAKPPAGEFDYRRRGCNENVIVGNDFSHAAAHGLELTFSFDNVVVGNRFAGNSICGIWAGYSQGTLIADNEFEANGDAGYGLERGGVNIEHGADNRIVRNRFSRNRAGVRLWWDEDAALAKLPWAAANGVESARNVVHANTFDGEKPAIHLRGPGSVQLGENKLSDGGSAAIEREDAHAVEPVAADLKIDSPPLPDNLPGARRPVGMRSALAGRERIILGPYGPWDHRSMFVRPRLTRGPRHVYEMFEFRGRSANVVTGEYVTMSMNSDVDPHLFTISGRQHGALPYTCRFGGGGGERGRPPIVVYEAKAAIVDMLWNVTVFPWDDTCDPRRDVEAWRARGASAAARRVGVDDLTLRFGRGAPGDVPALAAAVKDANIGADRFGVIARGSLEMRRGTWEVVLRSDDGVRVRVGEKALIENWTPHGLTRDAATLTLTDDAIVDFEVEYFEVDGNADLVFDVVPIEVSLTATQ
ncbi:MAG: right-handed parallel beta-helix repeat-containing protein [Phycisphaerales bacterium]|nr:right-handed parallel beta-helix repeat-containing protein [Phycisphaerales bacterium]